MTEKHIVFVTDAWKPLVNGVVRVIDAQIPILKKRGHRVSIIEPSQFLFKIPLPFYPEIKLALFPRRRVARMLAELSPDAIHIVTEGPLGFAASRICTKRHIPFTTAYHSHFALYAQVYVGRFVMPLVLWYLKKLHAKAHALMVSTGSLKRVLEELGVRSNIVIVPLGVDAERFVRNPSPPGPALPKPVFLYFSRLSADKSPEEFLKLDLPGTKLLVGDGPERARLETKYPTAIFTGYKHGQELVEWISKADVLVFPSRTETFGLVALEAMACGVPVAAYDEMGPRDIITNGVDGYISADLKTAAIKCLALSRDACRATALKYSWERTADAFLKNLAWIQK